ncbi:hypothetical protein Pfra02_44990 [Pseudomonas fragi]|nr:hypothetical protein Pfra02_44990 [Pseudomonas fragi]
MLSSLTDEESDCLCRVLCKLLEVGISDRKQDTDSEFHLTLSELDELMLSLRGNSYTEVDKVLNAIFSIPEIEQIFYTEAKSLIVGGSGIDCANSLGKLHSRAEHLLEFINDNSNADFYYMTHWY